MRKLTPTTKPARGTAWHYTIRRKLRAIVASGELLPTYIGAKPPELPVLWFSLNQLWEPTALKDQCDLDGVAPTLGKKQARKRAGKLIRFGYPAEKCIMWPLLGRKARIPPRIRIALERWGREEGANPADWCGTLQAIPLADLIVEVFDSQNWVAFNPR